MKFPLQSIKDWLKSPIFWARFFAYAIPLTFLLYVLYINFLPFGYNKTFIIDVGGPDDTKISEFYLEPSASLSGRKIATSTDGTTYTYRELNGSAFAVFKPKAILKDATITMSVEGDEGVFLIPPVINLDPATIDWDYSWDFTPASSTGKASIPKGLVGNAFVFDNEVTFNGRDTKLELPYSSNKFEDGPLTVYAEWLPKDSENNAQQIVGHYNWELWQNKESVEFRVGRMNNAQGPVYSLKYPITAEFFNTKHSAVAIYNPEANGYMDLYVDGNFAGRTYFGGDRIWKWYGSNNLSFGKSNHGGANYFNGLINKVNIISGNIIPRETKINLKIKDIDIKDISLLSLSSSTLKYIELNVSQK